MKKVFALTLIISCASVFFDVAHAQILIDGTFGYGIPTGDFADVTQPGYGIGGDIFFKLPIFPLQLGGRVAYYHLDAEDEIGGQTVNDGYTSIVQILPSARYEIGAPMIPFKIFGQFGLGLYRWSSEEEYVGSKHEDDGTDFGVCLGAGVKAKLSPSMSIIAMPLYHIIMSEDENKTYVTLNVGVNF